MIRATALAIAARTVGVRASAVANSARAQFCKAQAFDFAHRFHPATACAAFGLCQGGFDGHNR
jgi:hypothetical protein